MSILEQDIIRKKQINKALLKPKKDLEFEVGDNKEYKVKVIIDNTIYDQQTNNSNQMPGFSYLIL